MSKNIVWVDLETTGLDPRSAQPIELFVLVTTPDLVDVESRHFVLSVSDSTSWGETALRMHTASGLLAEAKASRNTAWDTDQLLSYWEVCRGLPLAGSSVHFDRAFLQHHFPRFESLLHYRNIDVSTIKELCKRWRPDALLERPESAHRAEPDVRASIAELAHYRTLLFGAPWK